MTSQLIKKVYRIDRRRVPTRACSDRTRHSFKLKEGQTGHAKEMFYNGGGETLGQAAQRSCGGTIIRSVQGQVGWGIEEPGLVKYMPRSSEGGLD